MDFGSAPGIVMRVMANGFYTGAARQAWHHMPPRVKSGLVGAFAVVCAAVMRVLLR